MVNRLYITCQGSEASIEKKTKEFLDGMNFLLGKEINGITLIEFGQQGIMTDYEYKKSLEIQNDPH